MADGQLSLRDHNLAMLFENDKIFIQLFNFPQLHLVYYARFQSTTIF
jgi:hypothetical protein